MNPARPLERVPSRQGFLARAVPHSHVLHSLRPTVETANPGSLLDQIGNTPLVRLNRAADLPGLECWSAQPATPLHGVEGTKHLPASIVPGIYAPDLADGTLWIDTEDCYAMARRVAREEGLLLGISAAGNAVAARRLGERLVAEGRPGVIVTIACDGAAKYLNEGFWNDPD